MTFQFRADDPLLAQARGIAKELGISQDGFSKLLGLYAGAQVASQQQITTARNAEVGKLGAAGPARIDAIATFYKAYLGEDDAKAEMSRIFTAADVMRAEKKIAKITSQGGGSFVNNGREPPPPAGRKSQDEVARMSPAQRLDYNRQFDQSKMPEWRDPRAA